MFKLFLQDDDFNLEWPIFFEDHAIGKWKEFLSFMVVPDYFWCLIFTEKNAGEDFFQI